MNSASSRTISDRASRYIQDALLQPAQVQDVVLDKPYRKGDQTQEYPEHAHGDSGHGDFFHADA